MRWATILLGLSAVACAPDRESAPLDTEGGTTGEATTLELPGTSSTTEAASTGTVATSDPDDSTGDTTGEPPASSSCDRLLEVVATVERSEETTEEAFAIRGLLDEIRYSADGFPIVEDERTCFVYVGDPGESLSVAGDFDDWDPTAHPLTSVPSELGLHYAVIDMPRAQAVGLYKFVRDGADFFADPEARRFGWDEFGEYSRLAPDPTRSHHERWREFEEGIGALEPRTITVYVPAGGFEAAALPTLYLHDGQNLFAPDALFGGWQASVTLDALIADGTIAPLLAIGIDNTTARFDEYTHVEDDLGGVIEGGQADAYGDFLVDGLIPFIDARYPTSTAVADTAVLGSSLGGLVSIYLGWRHPDVFGWAGAMSGSFFWGSELGNPTMAELVTQMPPTGLSIYLDSGGGAQPTCPADADNYCDTVELADALRAQGWIDEQDLVYRWEPGAMHNEAAWAARFGPMLTDWLFGG